VARVTGVQFVLLLAFDVWAIGVFVLFGAMMEDVERAPSVMRGAFIALAWPAVGLAALVAVLVDAIRTRLQ
jgi:hypothetical protein